MVESSILYEMKNALDILLVESQILKIRAFYWWHTTIENPSFLYDEKLHKGYARL